MTETNKSSVSTWPVWIGSAIGGGFGLAEGDLHVTLPLGFGIGYLVYLRASTRSENGWLRERMQALENRLDILGTIKEIPAVSEVGAAPVPPPAAPEPVSAASQPIADLDLLPLQQPDRVEPTTVPLAEDPARRETTPSQAAAPTPAYAAWSAHTEEPAKPSLVDIGIERAKAWLTGGNTVARVGLLVLFIGVAFLLRYVAEHTNVPIEWRLTGVALGAIALLVVGWRMRLSRPGYAVTLQGGAIGILYLTVFAAMRLYNVLTALPAFALLAALAVLLGFLAVLQNARALAVLGATGGFLAPILV